jgi:hypothetical protein
VQALIFIIFIIAVEKFKPLKFGFEWGTMTGLGLRMVSATIKAAATYAAIPTGGVSAVRNGTFALTGEGTIVPLTTVFRSYGPGLPMAGGGEHTTIENGLITVYHEEDPRKELRLWVSPQTGETLTLGSEDYDLAALSPEPMLVEITMELNF